jgi:hypothetical protein
MDLPKGTADNTAFFIDVVLPSLIENDQSQTRQKTPKGRSIHMNNALHQIRGELKGVSRSQEPNACRIQLTVQTWLE